MKPNKPQPLSRVMCKVLLLCCYATECIYAASLDCEPTPEAHSQTNNPCDNANKIAGVFSKEEGEGNYYSLYYRKATNDKTELYRLAEQSSEKLCGSNHFFWISMEENTALMDWSNGPVATPNLYDELYISLNCSDDPE